jgi:hypothetical protein
MDGESSTAPACGQVRTGSGVTMAALRGFRPRDVLAITGSGIIETIQTDTLAGRRTTTMNLAIETEDLAKRYGDVTAVEHLSLRVAEGEIYAFLGLNDASKTNYHSPAVGDD